MDSAGSFIPQNPVQGGGKPKRRVRHIYVVTYLIYIFFGVTLLSALGLWFYTQVLSGELASAQEELVSQSQQFDTRELERLEQLDIRLEQANQLFNALVPVHVIFTSLEEVLLDSAVVTGFTYDHERRQVVVSFRTAFTDFNGALFQRQMMRNHSLFQTASIQNVNYEEAVDSETGITATNLTYEVVAALDAVAVAEQNTTFMTATTPNENEQTEAAAAEGSSAPTEETLLDTSVNEVDSI